MKSMNKIGIVIAALACAALFGVAAYAGDPSGGRAEKLYQTLHDQSGADESGPKLAAAVNTTPKANVVGQNGLASPSILSTDPQIGGCVFSSTGVTVTESTLTTFASTAEYPCTIKRGALVDTDSTGLISIRRNGLYRVAFDANCIGVTTEVLRVTAQYSTDGGSTYAQIDGADARNQVITNALTQNLSGRGYLEVASTATALAAGNVVVALRGSSSGAGDMTCANGGGLTIERVDMSQPVTYP